MKYSVNAIIFDLDGTILNSISDIADCANQVLSENNMPVHPVDSYRYFVGEGARTLIRNILPEQFKNEDIIEEYLQRFKILYNENYNKKSYIYAGIIELLDELFQRKFKVAVFSNKPHVVTLNCLSFYLPDYSFNFIIGQGFREDIPVKPHPAGALHIAESLAIPCCEFLYIGDTATDMKTARSAGMVPVGVSWGFRPQKELIDAGAEIILQRPMELLNYIHSH